MRIKKRRRNKEPECLPSWESQRPTEEDNWTHKYAQQLGRLCWSFSVASLESLPLLTSWESPPVLGARGRWLRAFWSKGDLAKFRCQLCSENPIKTLHTSQIKLPQINNIFILTARLIIIVLLFFKRTVEMGTCKTMVVYCFWKRNYTVFKFSSGGVDSLFMGKTIRDYSFATVRNTVLNIHFTELP